MTVPEINHGDERNRHDETEYGKPVTLVNAATCRAGLCWRRQLPHSNCGREILRWLWRMDCSQRRVRDDLLDREHDDHNLTTARAAMIYRIKRHLKRCAANNAVRRSMSVIRLMSEMKHAFAQSHVQTATTATNKPPLLKASRTAFACTAADFQPQDAELFEHEDQCDSVLDTLRVDEAEGQSYASQTRRLCLRQRQVCS